MRKTRHFATMDRPRKGNHYRSLRETDVTGVIWFSAPFSFGFAGRLPKGEILHLDYDPPRDASGVWLVPLRYEHFEREFIPEETRTIEEYGNYTISMSLVDLAQHFELASPDEGAGVADGSRAHRSSRVLPTHPSDRDLRVVRAISASAMTAAVAYMAWILHLGHWEAQHPTAGVHGAGYVGWGFVLLVWLVFAGALCAAHKLWAMAVALAATGTVAVVGVTSGWLEGLGHWFG